MNNRPMEKNPKDESAMAERVGVRAVQMLKARRNRKPEVWFGLGMMGTIGWSVSVPTLLGAGIGIWLDKHHPGAHSWTLALLMAGLTLGCINAWLWVARQDVAMREELDNDET